MAELTLAKLREAAEILKDCPEPSYEFSLEDFEAYRDKFGSNKIVDAHIASFDSGN